MVLFDLRDAYGWIVGPEGFPSVSGLVVILVCSVLLISVRFALVYMLMS